MSNEKTTGDQPMTLFEPAPPKAGRHERMLNRALAAAEKDGRLLDVDAGLISLAIANAFALDRAELTKNAPYAISNVTGPYREVLQALGMTPDQRKEEANDEFARAVEALSETTIRD